MNWVLGAFTRILPFVFYTATFAAVAMAATVLFERAAVRLYRAWRRRNIERYAPIVRRAIAGDDAARAALAAGPPRHRFLCARLLLDPLHDDRDPALVARTRVIARELSVLQIAERYLQSRLWWRRALALRVLGLVQAANHTPQLVTALDDSHADVRAAALDGLADMHDAEAVHAIAVRLHDTSLHRGRRGAVLKAYGPDCEPLLLDMSEADPPNAVNYIHALAICGTPRSRRALCRWARDPRVEVQAAALEAMAYVGLDAEGAQTALDGLDSSEPHVRAMAAFALGGWQGGGAAARLATHLDDVWMVAARAARTLRSMGTEGAAELESYASRPGTAGLLARQMLWQPDDQR